MTLPKSNYDTDLLLLSGRLPFINLELTIQVRPRANYPRLTVIEFGAGGGAELGCHGYQGNALLGSQLEGQLVQARASK